MSETADMRPETNQDANTNSTPSLDTDTALLTPSLTTDSTDASNGGIEVHGKASGNAPTARHSKRKAPRELNIRQKAFVAALTNPDSPTYGKKGPSALKAGYVYPESAWEALGNPMVRNAIERELEAVNASSKVRLGVIAQLMHKGQHVTEQYNGDGELTSRTVVDNDKVRLAAAKELAKLDGSYQRAATIGHAQRKAVDAAVGEWTRRLRASLNAPPREHIVGDAQDVQDAGVVDTVSGTGGGGADALRGQESALAGTEGAGGAGGGG